MATYNKYLSAVKPMLEGMNSATDAYKIALCLTVNGATDTTFVAGTYDLATAGGYTAGGKAATYVSAVNTAGTYKLILNSPTMWTATGAGFTFRHAVLYDSTTNNLVGYWDYGSNVVMSGANSDTFTVTLDATNGVFQAS